MVLLPPLLFVAALESGLRLFGYGCSPRFLIPADRRGVLESNPLFTARFLSPSTIRVPVPIRVVEPKPAGVYRILLLGESAAMGFPNFRFGMGRILLAMLEAAFPDTRFELVNAAITGINSHVVLPIARDCADYQPDLVVVYMGNNEVIGPYGPSSVFGFVTPSLAAIRASIWVKGWRTGQLVRNLVGSLGRPRAPAGSWAGMEMFVQNQVAPDDPGLGAVYSHFQRNLRDISRIGLDVGAKVVVCTVAVNLRDVPPFASIHRSSLSPAELERWQRLYQQGIEAADNGHDRVAIDWFRRALESDDRYAELHFRFARSLLAIGESGQAATEFSLARDLDALRFRTDSRMNQLIRDTVTGLASDDVILADVERRLGTGGDGSGSPTLPKSATPAAAIPGDDLFYEHVHPRFTGNYRIAEAIFDQVVRLLPAAIRRQSGAARPLSMEESQLRLGYTDVARYADLLDITQLLERPPFSGQLGAAQRAARTKQRVEDLRAWLMGGNGAAECAEKIRRAIERKPDDPWLHYVLAQALRAAHLPCEAVKETRVALDMLPNDGSAMLLMAMGLDNCGDLSGAEQYYRQRMNTVPLEQTRSELLQFYLRHARYDDALRLVEILRSSTGDPQYDTLRDQILAAR